VRLPEGGAARVPLARLPEPVELPQIEVSEPVLPELPAISPAGASLDEWAERLREAEQALAEAHKYYRPTSSHVRQAEAVLRAARQGARQMLLEQGAPHLKALRQRYEQMGKEMLPTHPEMQKLRQQMDAEAEKLLGLARHLDDVLRTEDWQSLGILLVFTSWPFDAQEAARRQQETAAALDLPVEKMLDLGNEVKGGLPILDKIPIIKRLKKTPDLGNGVTMELVLIPAGEFMMGSPSSESDRDDDEGPQHRVRVTCPFYMGKCEVTNAQYRQFVRDSGYDGSGEADGGYLKHFRGDSEMPTGDNYPIVWVSWKNAQAFCQWLSRRTGWEVRLPTEAEWEYACRAGSSTAYCFGDSASRLGDYAWYDDNSGGKTHPVGGKRLNGWGLYDMHGNVWEWCADWYGWDYYAQSPPADPKGPSHSGRRVLRGGSWLYYPRFCRSAVRDRLAPTNTNLNDGFRVVVSPRP